VTADSAPAAANARTWASGKYIREYQSRDLRPVEAEILLRYRHRLEGRVLELGCGAGRVTGYLVELAREVHGIDIAPAMIDYCRRTWPAATFHEGDFTDLSAFAEASLDAVLAPCNVLDVLSDAERQAMLDELRRVLVPGGLFVMSSHNRGYVPNLRRPQIRASINHPRAFVDDVVKLPRRLRNRRRLVGLEQHADDYVIVNDGAHDFSLLHYFIFRDAQERQLLARGFELIECLDLQGVDVPPGGEAGDMVELHYVAQRAG
jgi:SAM-dependent methyltransferase